MHVITKNLEGSAGKSPCTADAGAVPLTIPITNPRHGDRRFQDERDDRHNPMTWEAPGLNERLMQLHAGKGHEFSTFQQMAGQLSDEFNLHITKSAVVGRARRLGLPPRLSFVRRKPKKPELKSPDLKPSAPVQSADSAPRNLTLYELGYHDCRWPYGETAPFLFCGNPTHKDSSWCRKHHKMAYARAGAT